MHSSYRESQHALNLHCWPLHLESYHSFSTGISYSLALASFCVTCGHTDLLELLVVCLTFLARAQPPRTAGDPSTTALSFCSVGVTAVHSNILPILLQRLLFSSERPLDVPQNILSPSLHLVNAHI